MHCIIFFVVKPILFLYIHLINLMSDLFSRCGRGGGSVSESPCITHGGWRVRRDRECDGGWSGESSDRSRSDERCGGNRRSPCSAASQRGSGDSRLLLWRARRERNTGLLCDGIVVVFLDAIASLLSTEEFSEVTFLNLLMVFLYVLSVLIDWKTG